MASAGRLGFGALSGGAGGAGIGSAILPGVGTAIGAGIGGLAGLLGAQLTDDEDDKKRKRAMAMLEQRQALERDASKLADKDALYALYGGNPGIGRALGAPARRALQGREQAYEWNAAKEGMKAEDPSAGDWIGALIGAGAAVAPMFKSDPNAARRAQLNSTSDEADWINAHDLPNRATAIEENDERTRSALFGPRRRLNPYEF
jgi:hypothetical protein